MGGPTQLHYNILQKHAKILQQVARSRRYSYSRHTMERDDSVIDFSALQGAVSSAGQRGKMMMALATQRARLQNQRSRVRRTPNNNNNNITTNNTDNRIGK